MPGEEDRPGMGFALSKAHLQMSPVIPHSQISLLSAGAATQAAVLATTPFDKAGRKQVRGGMDDYTLQVMLPMLIILACMTLVRRWLVH